MVDRGDAAAATWKLYRYGGFCGWGVAAESQNHTGVVRLPSVTIVDAGAWIVHANRTFLNGGLEAACQFESDAAANAAAGDATWASWFGADRAAWPFNTLCCSTPQYPTLAKCGHNPS